MVIYVLILNVKIYHISIMIKKRNAVLVIIDRWNTLCFLQLPVQSHSLSWRLEEKRRGVYGCLTSLNLGKTPRNTVRTLGPTWLHSTPNAHHERSENSSNSRECHHVSLIAQKLCSHQCDISSVHD